MQLKATPLVATITVVEIYAVSSRVRADTFIVYEPLLLLAVAYLLVAGVITLLFGRWERRGSGADLSRATTPAAEKAATQP